jgi:hypothetical protein
VPTAEILKYVCSIYPHSLPLLSSLPHSHPLCTFKEHYHQPPKQVQQLPTQISTRNSQINRFLSRKFIELIMDAITGFEVSNKTSPEDIDSNVKVHNNIKAFII